MIDHHNYRPSWCSVPFFLFVFFVWHGSLIWRKKTLSAKFSAEFFIFTFHRHFVSPFFQNFFARIFSKFFRPFFFRNCFVGIFCVGPSVVRRLSSVRRHRRGFGGPVLATPQYSSDSDGVELRSRVRLVCSIWCSRLNRDTFSLTNKLRLS